jgi:asparagine synthase (glutamine-hydrolysing)
MCGIVGIFKPGDNFDLGYEKLAISKMAGAIEHRGPDSVGYWFNRRVGIGLAHRRLAIVELSPLGAQPMVSQSGRYVIVFNGEIYNHCDLRKKIDASNFNSTSWGGASDTETILKCIDVWGIEKTLKELVGMFALGIWDANNLELVLVRDRFGEKPLYYCCCGSGESKYFLFGSDLAAIRSHPSFNGEINRNALSLYMRYSCIGGENTIYSKVRKLLPGQLLKVSVKKPDPSIQTWWDSVEVATKHRSNRFSGTASEACGQLEALIRQSTRQQMLADVPIGAFLSGGVDSSIITALMQLESNRPIKTFSIGFKDKQYDESLYARQVANILGTEHFEAIVNCSDALDAIPKMAELYSEPFADSSQIPMFLVSRLARQHVTVTLSGDGGDEVFGGYSRYSSGLKLWKALNVFPSPLRRGLRNLVMNMPLSRFNRGSRMFGVSRVGDKLQKAARLFESETFGQFYRDLQSNWGDDENPVLDGGSARIYIDESDNDFEAFGKIEGMMLVDIMGYLPDDILTKVDRAAMGVSLETRIPLLDHRVVEFAWSLPLEYKIRDGIAKWPLKKILSKYVPRELVDRPKMGFGVPIGAWLRGPLRDWVEEQLSVSRLKNEGFLKPELIRERWRQHLTGERNCEHQLWSVLMFQSWLIKSNG